MQASELILSQNICLQRYIQRQADYFGVRMLQICGHAVCWLRQGRSEGMRAGWHCCRSGSHLLTGLSRRACRGHASLPEQATVQPVLNMSS